MALLASVLSWAAPIHAQESAPPLRLGDLFQVPQDAEAQPDPQDPPTPQTQWTTWDPDAPPVTIPPAEWFRDGSLDGPSANAELEAILSRLLDGAEVDVGELNLNVRRLGEPGERQRLRRHAQSPIIERGRESDGVRGHARLRITNASPRHGVQLTLSREIEPGSDEAGEVAEENEPITLILPPETSETMAIPAGSYTLRRKTWNPHASTHVTYDEIYAACEMREQWAYELTLRPSEDDRIGRELEKGQPVIYNAAP